MREARYDSVSILIHWATALIVGLLFATAWAREHAAENAETLLAAHRALGMLVWLLTLARLNWRQGHASPEPPLAPLHKLAAKSSQFLLLTVLVVQPATGITQSLARGRPFSLLVATVPALLPRDKAVANLFHELHEMGAWALSAVVGLHAAAALMHHFVLRDEVLRTMLPAPLRRTAPQPLLASTTEPGE